ncbi:beta-mannosidase [Flavobacterium terrisoli]|uniref:beta-mannosidase n=1 Tax=Flavobacterium terrisoli TaxID=3242195 RepID=UPI0025437245|nr:glycoside hydrolase family 2 protein [Flavobacterium buctense]
MRTLLLKFVIVFLLPMVLWSQNTERNLSSEQWTFRKVNDSNWLPAKVPGTVHTDLLANKIIPDPFFGANEKQLQWIENEDWQYQTTFNVSKEELTHQNAILQFDGLDTFGEVYLNGTQILSANNMFRTWKVDVKKVLKVGLNKLEITFASAVKKGKEEAKKLSYTLPGDEKVFVRKAQYHYGWDWGPRFVTSGIYKRVALRFWNNATFKSVSYKQNDLNEKIAQLEFQFVIEAAKSDEYIIRSGNVPFKRKLKKGTNTVSIPFTISDPILWWPNGMGVAHQYLSDFSLYYGEQKLEDKRVKIGLRTIELVQEKDAIGRSFYFKVNGKPVFMKGANYIPPDSFLPRATDSVYKSIVKNAVDSNMNMLRVWGGGVYADDAFYDECDKNGILVWQDFMFACAMYPGDEAFLENVKQEVIDNVSRLQNHPSIALWCGNNENDEGWHNWGWQKQYNYSEADSTKIWNDYQKLFHELIPQTLDNLLPKNENRYWPSSPSIGWGRKESLLSGDSHYWGVWWGMEPFEMYQKKVGRFMSEYGFQGMPDIKTFQAFAKKDELKLDSEAVKHHQKHNTGYKTINEYMARDYQVATNFEDYIYVSQLLQADGMKMAIEAHRTAMPDCMGTLFWQLNDCWPVTSWSSVDYFGKWKAMQYQVKRSFEDFLITVKEEENQYDVAITNDNMNPYDGEFETKLFDFNGKLLWEDTTFINIPGNFSFVHLEVSKKVFEQFDLRKVVCSLQFKPKERLSTVVRQTPVSNLYYFVKPKDLQLTKPTIQITKIDELIYEISSDVLAKNVFLSSEEDTFFSDNYFDVLPNKKMQIKLSKPVSTIMVKSLFDTMH